KGEGRLLLALSLGSRAAQGVVLDHEPMQLVEWLLLVLDPSLELIRCRADGLLEERQQQLLLPAEVLVEAPQRLPRLLDHVLDGEVLPRLAVAQQLEGGVDEALHAVLGPHPCRVERSGHSLLPPAGGGRFGCRLVGGHTGNLTGPEKRTCLSGSRKWRFQTAGSATASRLVEPLSGTFGCRHTSTGNETVTREQYSQSRRLASSGSAFRSNCSRYAVAASILGKAAS